jgi:hypothetical protein
MKKATTRTAIIIVVLVAAVVGYYAYLSNKNKASQEDTSLSVVESTLSRDLSKDYPPTPKEVVKYYNEILRCLYNEENTEEEVEALGLQSRELYDQELLDANEIGTYLMRLQSEVDTYKENGWRITGFNLAASTNVEMFEKDGYSFAKIMCGYNILQDGQTRSTNQMYLLRKDENKRWKIYGWEDTANLTTESE